MNYRTEIDGLRAVAISPVLLFHFGWETLSGGFLGVDIFLLLVVI
jgi:peptidoglycan/LPS O-acetylase OafA/YrhL